MSESLSKLVSRIELANAAYAVGRPIMSDTDYDSLWRHLRELDPSNSALYHTARDPNLDPSHLPHPYPIFSPAKAFETEELKPFFARFGTEEIILEPKYDGCAAMLYLQADGSIRLVKEGNGIHGEDISRHLYNFISHPCPRRAESVELIIPLEYWDSSWGKNPRNTIAGWINSIKFPQKAVGKCEIVSHNHGWLSHSYVFDGDFEKLTELLLRLYSEWSTLYPLDGIMLKVADEERRLIAGHSSTCYNWSIAWKPSMQIEETVVLDIEWNVSRSGRLVPTIVYAPLELCGTTNTRVTGNNAQWLSSRGVVVGSRIRVGKAGEIIPKLVDVLTPSEVVLPSECPICKSPLSISGVDLLCLGENCLPRLVKRLSYFYSDKGMDIKTIGDKRIEELLSDQQLYALLVERPWALLAPSGLAKQSSLVDLWGIKRVSNYLDSLIDASGTKNQAHFIAALGYPGLAYKSALKLCQILAGQKVESSNISQKSLDNFVLAIADWHRAQDDLRGFAFTSLPLAGGIRYCITGSLSSPRNDIVNHLSSFSWTFVNQVSKHTNYLVLGESGEGTTKHRKAVELGTKIITEEKLYDLLKETNK